jgi:hypothetical protein
LSNIYVPFVDQTEARNATPVSETGPQRHLDRMKQGLSNFRTPIRHGVCPFARIARPSTGEVVASRA